METEKTPWKAMCLNMLNAVLGTGVMSIPFAFRLVGWNFVMPYVVVVLITGYCADILWRMMQTTKTITYDDIAAEAFGQRGLAFISAIRYPELFCVGCIFLIVMSSSLGQLFQGLDFTMCTVISAICVWPTIMVDSYKRLSLFSMSGLITTGLLFFCLLNVMFRGETEGAVDTARTFRALFSEEVEMLEEEQVVFSENASLGMDGVVEAASTKAWLDPAEMGVGWEAAAATSPAALVKALGISIFALGGHVVFPDLYHDTNPADVRRMIGVAWTLLASFTFLFGALAFALFGADTASNITLNLPQGSFQKVILVAVFLNMFFTFPLLFKSVSMKAESMVPDLPPFVVRSFILLMQCAVAYFVPFFSTIAAFTGVIFANTSNLVCPALFHLKLMSGSMGVLEKLWNVLIVVLGCTLIVVGLVSTATAPGEEGVHEGVH